MADFVAVLKKTLGGLGETTPEIRSRVYDKARATIAAKLAALDPQPPAAVAERQKKMLEDAIAEVEREYAPPPPPPAEVDPLAELEHLFSSIDRNKNQTAHAAPSVSPPAAPPATPRPGPVASPSVAGPPEPAPKAPERAVEPAVAEKPVPPAPQPPPAPEPRREPGPEATVPPQRAAPPAPQPSGFDRPLAGSVPVQDEADDVFDRVPETHHPVSPRVERRPEMAFGEEEEEDERRSYKGLIAAVAALVVLAGGGYAAWLNKDAIGTMFAGDSGEPKPVVVKPVKVPPPDEETASAGPPAPAPSPASNGGETSDKFTQRLLPDGKEVDPGPAGGGSTIGEGSSVVALTTPPPASAPDAGQPAAPVSPPAPQGESAQAGVAVGQKAIYYEERTNVAQGSAEAGNVVWSLVQESPGGDEPPEPAIRGEVQVPGKDVQLRMTIRRNADETLPASHIIEMIFLTPAGFEGGGIDNLLRIALKKAEQDAGSPLIGIPAKIADGYFLVALNDTKADEDANLSLLRNQEWIDVPVIYKSGRRALLTMEKGMPGGKVFDEAIRAWQAKTAG
jgi:hypothetical protein